MPSNLVKDITNCTTFAGVDVFLTDCDDTEKTDIIDALESNPSLLKRLVLSINCYEDLIELINRSPYYILRSEILAALNQQPNHLLKLCAPSLEVVKRAHEELRDNYSAIIAAIAATLEILRTIAPTLADFIQLRSLDWSQFTIFNSCLFELPGIFEHYIVSTGDFCAALEGLAGLETQLWQKLMENPGRIMRDANDKLLLLPIAPKAYQADIKKIEIVRAPLPLAAAEPQQQRNASIKPVSVEAHHGHRRHRSSYGHPQLARRNKSDETAKKSSRRKHIRHVLETMHANLKGLTHTSHETDAGNFPSSIKPPKV